ncbi:5-formyltetrahydrofolate cyclo-ligase [Qipengyuania sp. DGS5-3]|uniref:5-formyltetrahydrofolate cyclo-ligase n=1 Tax=Qipengyuania sp. DGS5-3 TaxID=3349632 RepID=UPI0036D28450
MSEKLSKTDLRKSLRSARKAHVAALPESARALILHRPPAPLLMLIPEDAVIGLYHATANEAPASGYAKFFQEAGHAIALPWFESEAAPMEFAAHTDPFDAGDCERGPFGIIQPLATAPAITPNILFVPLVGFTTTGDRLGQGMGHYDRWLAAHPGTVAIGLAWDCQLHENLPIEEHDQPLSAVVTPTRFYGPF